MKRLIDKMRSKFENLAGRWTMSDKEAKNFEKELREGWKKWKINNG
ncbi:hypothetical protein J4207_01600 [Candidatus Woesearchaeota archaeon]|nr:hypothetical protein [Candidatus Woesearchaeota archaeon]